MDIPQTSEPTFRDNTHASTKKSWWKSSAPQRPGGQVILVSTLGSVIALTLLAAITVGSGVLLLIPPMAASMALIMGAPGLPLSQPRNVIGGQVISAIVGILVGLAGDSLWLGAAAGGLALGAMMLARMPHSPAAATAIIGVASTVVGWQFILLTAAAASILVLVGIAGNRANSSKYPVYLW